MDDFGLTSEAHRKVMDLSGGFSRRVQVAKVFMVDTPVVFLDEFSTGMDPILKRSVMDKLRGEAAGGRTIVLTTQILSEVEELCDDILILNRGRQAARGDLHTLKLLSQGVYDVTVTFDRLPAGIEEELAARHPIRLSISQNTVEVTLKEDARRHPRRRRRARGARARAAPRGRRREPRRHFRRADQGRAVVSGLSAVMYREGKIRATNALFIFWDVVYPLGYLLVFGVGMNEALGFSGPRHRLPLVLPRGGARDGRLRHRVEHRVVVLHGPRQRHLLRDADLSDEPRGVPGGKSAVQHRDRAGPGVRHRAARRRRFSGWRCGPQGFPLLAAAVIVGTAGWFFFYAIFALAIRRNDAFNTVTSIFYFVFLFASSMFYPIEPLPAAVSRRRAGEPDHLARGRHAVRDHRAWRSAADRARGGRLRGVHAGVVCRRARSCCGARGRDSGLGIRD